MADPGFCSKMSTPQKLIQPPKRPQSAWSAVRSARSEHRLVSTEAAVQESDQNIDSRRSDSLRRAVAKTREVSRDAAVHQESGQDIDSLRKELANLREEIGTLARQRRDSTLQGTPPETKKVFWEAELVKLRSGIHKLQDEHLKQDVEFNKLRSEMQTFRGEAESKMAQTAAQLHSMNTEPLPWFATEVDAALQRHEQLVKTWASEQLNGMATKFAEDLHHQTESVQEQQKVQAGMITAQRKKCYEDIRALKASLESDVKAIRTSLRDELESKAEALSKSWKSQAEGGGQSHGINAVYKPPPWPTPEVEADLQRRERLVKTWVSEKVNSRVTTFAADVHRPEIEDVREEQKGLLSMIASQKKESDEEAKAQRTFMTTEIKALRAFLKEEATKTTINIPPPPWIASALRWIPEVEADLQSRDQLMKAWASEQINSTVTKFAEDFHQQIGSLHKLRSHLMDVLHQIEAQQVASLQQQVLKLRQDVSGRQTDLENSILNLDRKMESSNLNIWSAICRCTFIDGQPILQCHERHNPDGTPIEPVTLLE